MRSGGRTSWQNWSRIVRRRRAGWWNRMNLIFGSSSRTRWRSCLRFKDQTFSPGRSCHEGPYVQTMTPWTTCCNAFDRKPQAFPSADQPLEIVQWRIKWPAGASTRRLSASRRKSSMSTRKWSPWRALRLKSTWQMPNLRTRACSCCSQPTPTGVLSRSMPSRVTRKRLMQTRWLALKNTWLDNEIAIFDVLPLQ